MSKNKAFSFLCVVLALCAMVCTAVFVYEKYCIWYATWKSKTEATTSYEERDYQSLIDKIDAELKAENEKNERVQNHIDAQAKKRAEASQQMPISKSFESILERMKSQTEETKIPDETEVKQES